MDFGTTRPVFRPHYHVIVAKLYNLSIPWFSFSERCNNRAYFLRLERPTKTNEPIYALCLVNCLAHSKHSISAILFVSEKINWDRRKFIFKGNMNSRGRGGRVGGGVRGKEWREREKKGGKKRKGGEEVRGGKICVENSSFFS